MWGDWKGCISVFMYTLKIDKLLTLFGNFEVAHYKIIYLKALFNTANKFHFVNEIRKVSFFTTGSFRIFNRRTLDESTMILLEAADLELIVDILQPNFEGYLTSERGFLEVLGLMQSTKLFEILDRKLRNQIKNSYST